MVSGSVVRVYDVSGEARYFVALPGGIQPIPETVATMLRNAGVADGGAVCRRPRRWWRRCRRRTGFDTSVYPSVALSWWTRPWSR